MKALATRNRGAILLLMFNIFIGFVGVGLVIPIMPTYMNVLGISGTIVGLLVAVFSLTQFLVAPYAGSWSDRYGRKWIIVTGLLLFAVSELLFGLATNAVLLFISRLLGGVSVAFIMPAVMAYVVDITTEEDRGMGMGWINAAISTGFIIGPAIGGFLVEYGMRVPFFAAAGAAALSAVVSMSILPESLDKSKLPTPEARMDRRKESQLAQLAKSYRTPYFTGLLIILITSLGLSQFETVLGLFVDHKYSYTPNEIAWLIMIGAIVGAVMQLTLFGRLINWIGEKKLTVYCLLVMAVFMVATIFSAHYWMMVVSVTLVFLAVDFVRPAISTYFSRIAGNEQGLVAGLNASYTSLGNIGGPILAGALFDVQINSPFLVGSLIALGGWVLSLRWMRTQTERSPGSAV
ncbi:MFS transporter [Shouchella clausii]|uniref:MFS transporter n=1 Tax=Shouchella clausii TaxID=79880 RepID=A0A268RUL9_SHOCL|nr:MFS transporter [Shouchella clausii]PAD41806.1 MFS transporter [Bacillus sp. 7520-S]MBU8598188.1 MFS transporter [Shouchella clausii]MCM3548981.1 MFS transporter [Shouchella clausii]MCY1106902.1 MFS transporter [Shouchella clausii]MED4158051.1 MFS transporter [Shouchella clausii]